MEGGRSEYPTGSPRHPGEKQSVTARWRSVSVRLARWVILLGVILAAVGYFGPWVAHPTAALTLTGPDLGEFVKFLPQGAPGWRQLFYAPVIAVVATIALLARSYPWLVRGPLLPAWNVPALRTTEFRVQTVALLGCWALLLGHEWLGRLPRKVLGGVVALIAVAAAVVVVWQYAETRLAIGQVYSANAAPPAVGWGLPVCLVGLALLVAGGWLWLYLGEVALP
jgi:hypothetical protein